MTKPRKAYKPKPVYYPTLVIDHTCGKELEDANWDCLNAFIYGKAEQVLDVISSVEI